MPNIPLQPYRRPSMWRRMSFANWKNPTDPQVYGRLEIDMKKAFEYLKIESDRYGIRITPTHLAVRAVALALAKYAESNAIIRLRRAYLRRNVDVFCQVAIPGDKPDLSGTVIREADKLGIAGIASTLSTQAEEVREGRDGAVARARRNLDILPGFMYRPVLGFLSLIQYTLNINPKFMGLPRDPFGGAMVTSVGSLGIPEGWAPLVPMSKTPIVICVGEINDKAVAVNGTVEVRPVCVYNAVFDHRIMDGFLAGKITTFIRDYLKDPAAAEADYDPPAG